MSTDEMDLLCSTVLPLIGRYQPVNRRSLEAILSLGGAYEARRMLGTVVLDLLNSGRISVDEDGLLSVVTT
jgi:hypothetical protein